MAAAERPLVDAQFVAFDLETTGLSPTESRVVEFGAVRFRLGEEELGTFQQLVNPGFPIPRVAANVHGIDDAMVRDMPWFAEVLPRFLEFLGPADTILLAHNARFDRDFLAAPAGKMLYALPGHAIVDTLDLSQRCLRGLFRYRLEVLARYLRIADFEEHRALSDARLVMELFRRILFRTPRLRTVEQLFRLSPPLHFQEDVAPEPGAMEDDLAAVIARRVAIVMVYEGGTKGASQRRITPRRLSSSNGRPCLIAWCHVDQMEKTFRLDRIREFRVEE